MSAVALGTWRNPPLAYVVAELAIAPHYTIGNLIPAIQDALRSEYPRTSEVVEFSFDQGQAAAAPSVQPSVSKGWRLVSIDQQRGVYVGPRAISLHATTYLNFTDFLEHWKRLLSAVKQGQLDAFVERVGLRYVDYVIPSEGHDAGEYVVENVRGLLPPQGISVDSAMSATSFQTDGVLVQARVAAPAPAGTLLPPSFNPLPLAKPSTLARAEEHVAKGGKIGFIDTDCGVEVLQLFDGEKLAAILSQLHSISSKTFKAMLSEHATMEWK